MSQRIDSKQVPRGRASPAPQIGLFEKTVVVVLLGLGVVTFWVLLTRARVGLFRAGHPRPSPSATTAPVHLANLPDVNTIRGHFKEDQPQNAIREIIQVLEADGELVLKDQVLVELEQNMERLDRNILYQALDAYHRQAKSPRQKDVDSYLQALMASKTFLYERHNPKQAIESLDHLAAAKDSPLAPLALNKRGMLLLSQNPDQAIGIFLRQIREFPDCALNGFASLMIGTCFRALEKDQQALTQYKDTLERYKGSYGEGGLPLEPYVRHALADTMIKMGDKEGARSELTLIVNGFHSYPYISIIQETLTTLPPAHKG
jgi:tetratricopeptide (TPR) repeat protein